MFKNAKLLKGSTIALACALVLCLGVVFGIYYAGAAANTVTLYVSNHGDNTTGADEASAFTSILEATTAANEMALKPGTKLRILVVERVSVTTNKINSQVLDTAGNVVPVTVEGYGFDGDEGNRPEIYCEWYDTGNNKAYRQWLLLDGDITFRDVKFLSKLHDNYAENKTSGITNRYCTRYFYASGYHGTFDNVVFTTEAPNDIKWDLRADDYASASVRVQGTGRSGFTLKNGDYSNCKINISNYPTSNYDLDVSFENATLPAVNLLTSSNTEKVDMKLAQKANSITVTFGAGTVVTGAFTTNTAKGYYIVPKGITVNFMEGCLFEGAITSTSKITSETVTCDHTFNYYGGEFKGDIYSGFSGTVTGNLTNNIYGGKFGTFRGAGTLSGVVQEGTVTNNVKGGTFSSFHGTAHMGNCNAVINNISGGEFSTFYGTSLANGATSITNNITGGTFKNTFHGAGDGGRENIPDLVTNNITGGTFNGTVYLGKSNVGYSGAVGKIVNNVQNVTFAGTIYCGGGGVNKTTTVKDADGKTIYLVENEETGNWERSPDNKKTSTYVVTPKAILASCGDIENNFKNCTFKGLFYGGSLSGVTGDVVNNVSDCQFASWYFGGCGAGVTLTHYTAVTEYEEYSTSTEKFLPTAGNITNNLTNVTVTGSNRSAMGNEYGNSGDITNNLKECTFESTGTYNYYGGPLRGTAGDITNNFTDCYFAKPMNCGGGYTESVSNQGHVANITNNIQGTTFAGAFRAGVLVGDTSGDIVTNVYEGNEFKDTVAFANAGGETGGTVTANLLGESTFSKGVYGGGAMYKSLPSNASVTLNIKAGIFKAVVCGGSNSSSGRDKDIVVNISGGTFEKAVTASGSAPYDSAVLNIKPDESAVPLTFKAAVSNSTENVTTTIYGSNKPINLANSTVIYADALAGTKNITFCQTAQWTSGTTYVSLPDSVDASRIVTLNKSSDVAGTAEVKTEGGRVVVAGASGTGTVIGAVAPKLNGYSFILDNKLKVNFLIPVSQIEAYIGFAGSWDYSIALEGIELVAGSFASVSEIPAASIVNGAGDVQCFAFATDLGIAATDFDKKITISWSGNEDVFVKSAYELLEGGINSTATKANIVTLLKAIYNYGIEAENVFEGANTALKYTDITYTGTYNSAPSRTSAEDGFEFFATSLSLDDEVALNFYLKLADGVNANQLTFTAKNAAGNKLVDASKIDVKPVEGVAEYDVIVSVKLAIHEMADSYILTAALDGTTVATCSNSIASSCAAYIATQNKFAPVSKALLAYIEKAVAAL